MIEYLIPGNMTNDQWPQFKKFLIKSLFSEINLFKIQMGDRLSTEHGWEKLFVQFCIQQFQKGFAGFYSHQT